MEKMNSLFDKDPKRFVAWSVVAFFMGLAAYTGTNIPLVTTSTYDQNLATSIIQHSSIQAFDGEIDVLIIDDFDEHAHEGIHEYYLRDSRGFGTKLNMSGVAKETLEHLRTGDKIKIRGKKNPRQEIEVENLQILAEAPTVMEESVEYYEDEEGEISIVTNERKAITLLINFADRNTSMTVSKATGILYTNTWNVDRWYRASTWNQIGFIPDTDKNGTADVFGPFNIASRSDSGTCSYYTWAQEAETLATQAGIDLSLYQHRIFIIPPHSSCSWSGVANLGCGTFCRSWNKDNTSERVWLHELGHNLGMHHASTDPENDGVLNSEYGDSSDPMGRGSTFFNSAHDVKSGWSTVFPEKLVDVTGGGSYTIAPMTVDPRTSQHPQILRIRKGTTNEYYFISFRKAESKDSVISSAFTNGASIHRATISRGTKTALITTLSSTNTTWSDSANGITVTQMERASDGSSVTVHIDYEAVCSPNQPTVTLTPTSQSSATGGTFTFDVTVLNNDSTCTGTTFTPSLSGTGVSGSFTPTQSTIIPGNSTKFTLSLNATQNGDWPFTVTVRDTDGVSPVHADTTVSGKVSIDTESPSTPTLSGTVNKQGAVSLSWNASTDNVGVIGYDVIRDGQFLITVTGTGYTDKPAQGTYTYTVRARDAAQNLSAQSNAITLTVAGKKTGKPDPKSR